MFDPDTIDAMSLREARMKAIYRIWAIVGAENIDDVRLDRRIAITDERGNSILIVTFAEALAFESAGNC